MSKATGIKKVEQLHNTVVNLVKHYISAEIPLAEIILILEVIKSDLVRQKASLMYSPKRPKPLGGKKHGV